MSRILCTAWQAGPVTGIAFLLAGFAGTPVAVAAPASEAETPVNIVADQIRRQGYKCENPKSAERDAQASRPDEPMWILTCENATYRVRLKPDMAADVEQAN